MSRKREGWQIRREEAQLGRDGQKARVLTWSKLDRKPFRCFSMSSSSLSFFKPERLLRDLVVWFAANCVSPVSTLDPMMVTRASESAVELVPVPRLCGSVVV